MSLSPIEEELLELRDQVDELKAEIRARDAAYAQPDPFPLEWDLKRAEQLALSALVRAGGAPVSNVGLRLRLYGDRCFSNDRSLYVLICRLRAKLAPSGIQIETHKTVGYALDATSVGRLRPYIGNPGPQ